MTVAHPAVRPAAVRRKVESWLAERDDAPAIALRARPEWTGDPVLTVAGTPVRVVPCPTPIAARAALADRAEPERLVLLTPLTDADLGDGLLAHLSRQTTRSVDPWDLVRQAFGNEVKPDQGLIRVGRWVADALTELAPMDGWPPPQGTILTREYALRHLAGELLGLAPDVLDGAGLLQWSTNAPAQLRFVNLPADWADGIAAFLDEVAGPAAVPVLTAVRAGHGVDVVPLGLLAGVLWPRGESGRPDVEIAVARTRLEPRFGGTRLTGTQAAAFLDAAEAWLYRALDGDEATRREARRMLHRAEEIAAEIDVSRRLAASVLLPSGFAQRMREFAAAVRLAVPTTPGTPPAAGLVGKAQNLLARVEEHRAADRIRVETARMAVRLLRWLVTAEPAPPATLLDATLRQVREDAWVDRARLDIVAGDPDGQVAQAYQALHRAVEARRSRHDHQFADLLQDMTAAEREPGALLRVEDVLDRVVQPILDAGRRVLLLILDGMSTAASAEIAESVARGTGWLELTPGGGPRTGVLAALPTVTEVSRYSLLAGRIGVGDRSAETKAFTERFPDGLLLHKGRLRAVAGAAVDTEVTDALDDPTVPVVAAVINTIDDALDRSDPGLIEWGTETVGALRSLLAVTHDRVVVIVSDHGHVVDPGPDSVVRPSSGSDNRWRPATEPVGEGELEFAGSRVAYGGRVVLPWRENLRYGPRKAGYHGGASPAEAVIPLLVFSAYDDNAVPGWAGAPVASPQWWRESLAEPSVAAQPADATVTTGAGGRPNRRQRPPAQDESLFELPVPDTQATSAPRPAAPSPAGPGDREAALVAALLASPVYADRRDARAPLPDARVAALVGALVAGNGRATLDTLATRADVPAYRIRGILTALQRLLQVEGYPVLVLDADGHTAKLDIPLLVEQFGLESS
ncbi:BREX-2 system phosphatase PglZ [Plantactinospora sp. GCM10030261]|uniref:BREX-2 system phosphatase PglZ n=1 Tax=Plantactinospora sp. GCM10030261 TaxID=3273420 RepID=UPI00361B527F